MPKSLPSEIRLQPDELVLASFRRSGWPVVVRKVLTLGLFTFWWRACVFVVTDQRVYIKEGILSESELSLPMRFIQDAALRRSVLGVGSVVVSTAGGAEGDTLLGPLKPAAARELADAILAQAHARWDTTSAQ